jgi:hypothetical protein
MEGWRGSGATRALDRDACQTAAATPLPRSFRRKRAVEFGGHAMRGGIPSLRMAATGT